MRETVANRGWIKKNLTTIARIGVVIVFLLLAIWAITLQHYNLVIGYSGLALWLTTALIDVAPELAGIVIGVVTIDYLNERRQGESERKELKARLTRDLLSNVTDFAVRAIDELREHGWLDDVFVENKHRFAGVRWEGADLQGVDLKEAELVGAQLVGARMSNTQFQQARLVQACLDNAYLVSANFEGAYLGDASLEGANLMRANLAGARLMGVKLQSANLKYVDLTGAVVRLKDLMKAETLYGATMQNGTKLRRQQDNPNGPTFEEWVALQEAVVNDDHEE